MSNLINQVSFDQKYDEIYKDIMQNYNIDYESAKEVFKVLVKAGSKNIIIDSLSEQFNIKEKINCQIVLEELIQLGDNIDGGIL